MKGSGTAQWVDRAILGLLGIIVMLLGAGIVVLVGAGIVVLALEHTTFQSLERIVVVGAAVALIAVGLRHVVAAVTGRPPSWYLEFLFHVGR